MLARNVAVSVKTNMDRKRVFLLTLMATPKCKQEAKKLLSDVSAESSLSNCEGHWSRVETAMLRQTDFWSKC